MIIRMARGHRTVQGLHPSGPVLRSRGFYCGGARRYALNTRAPTDRQDVGPIVTIAAGHRTKQVP